MQMMSITYHLISWEERIHQAGYWLCMFRIPESEVHGATMGLIWGPQDPGGPHVGPMNLAIWDVLDSDGKESPELGHYSTWNIMIKTHKKLCLHICVHGCISIIMKGRYVFTKAKVFNHIRQKCLCVSTRISIVWSKYIPARRWCNYFQSSALCPTYFNVTIKHHICFFTNRE